MRAPCLRAIPVLLLLILGFLAGCARVRPGIEDLPLPAASEIFQKVENNYQALKDFTASGVAVFSGDTLPRTAAGLKVRHLRPDYLELSLRGALGFHLGTLVLARGRYRMEFGGFQPLEGWIEDFAFPAALGPEFGAGELLDMFLPLIHAPSIPDTAVIERDREAQAFMLSWTEGRLSYRLWADPYQPVFTRSLVLAEGDTLAFKQVEAVKKRSGVFLPQAWQVRLGKDQAAYRLELEFRDMKVNTGLDSADFPLFSSAPPDTAEVPDAP